MATPTPPPLVAQVRSAFYRCSCRSASTQPRHSQPHPHPHPKSLSTLSHPATSAAQRWTLHAARRCCRCCCRRCSCSAIYCGLPPPACPGADPVCVSVWVPVYLCVCPVPPLACRKQFTVIALWLMARPQLVRSPIGSRVGSRQVARPMDHVVELCSWSWWSWW